MRIAARAPGRVDPAGGGTDAPPYCSDYGGAVVNFSVARHSYASFQRLPEGKGVTIYSHDLKTGVHAPSVDQLTFDGRIDFLKAFVKRMLGAEKAFILTTQSEIPERAGLGGSGAMGVAIVGAVAKATRKTMSKAQIALLANDIERGDLGHAGGDQDSYGAAVGGAKLVLYAKGSGASSCSKLETPERILYQLERNSLLIYTGAVHLSGAIHADIKSSYEQPDSPTVQAMHGLKSAAVGMAHALEHGDLESYVKFLNASRLHHYALHPSCDSDTLRNYFKVLEKTILGGKTCGAGGGGFILVYARSDRVSECVSRAEALGGMVWRFKMDQQGVTAWEEEDAEEQEVNRLIEGAKKPKPPLIRKPNTHICAR